MKICVMRKDVHLQLILRRKRLVFSFTAEVMTVKFDVNSPHVEINSNFWFDLVLLKRIMSIHMWLKI